jgi:hypothetical protein
MTTVVLSGALAQRPRNGGHAWVFLNWLFGLRSLGWDVLFLDRLEPGMLDHPDDPVERSPQWSWLRAVMVAAGFDGQFALLFDGNRQSLGMERSAIIDRCRRATVLFNLMGYLDDEELLGAVGTRVFVDLDPGFPQMWRDLGLADSLVGHDAFVTVGLAVGTGSSRVPTCGKKWLPTPPPVDLPSWPAAPARQGARTRMTTVATWRGPFAPVEYDSTTYGLRVHEHRAYWDLPRMVPEIDCEVALDIDDADRADSALLTAGGWCLVDPARAADTTERYRRYLYDSDAELAVAKSIYVRTRGGWFSDRSACYLASGRPVIAQDTGFSNHLPTGEGLVAFTSPDEAAAGATDVASDLARHSRAAREVAFDYLDAKKVLHSVLSRVGAA